jgi:hypothetical protein
VKACATDSTGWCLDRKVNIPTVLAALTMVVSLVGFGARVESKVCALEERAAKLELQGNQVRAVEIKMERLEERVAGMQRTLTEIRDELRRGK